mgnify:FL=1
MIMIQQLFSQNFTYRVFMGYLDLNDIYLLELYI